MATETPLHVKNPTQQALIELLKDPLLREIGVRSAGVSFLAEDLPFPKSNTNKAVIDYEVACRSRSINPYREAEIGFDEDRRIFLLTREKILFPRKVL